MHIPLGVVLFMAALVLPGHSWIFATEPQGSQNLKQLLFGPLQETFADPWCKIIQDWFLSILKLPLDTP